MVVRRRRRGSAGRAVLPPPAGRGGADGGNDTFADGDPDRIADRDAREPAADRHGSRRPGGRDRGGGGTPPARGRGPAARRPRSHPCLAGRPGLDQGGERHSPGGPRARLRPDRERAGRCRAHPGPPRGRPRGVRGRAGGLPPTHLRARGPSVRRTLTLASVAVALVLASAGPAAAHGIGGRLDLPVPIWLFVYGAAAAVIISFVALGALWRTPRLEEDPPGRPLPEWMQRMLTGPVPDAVVRTLSLVLFVVVLVAAASGQDSSATNLAPVFVFVWFWVGLAFVHALFGNWWATLSPWDTIARALGIGERARVEYPKALGAWPSAVLLLAFLWLELVYSNAASPRTLFVAILVYTAITLTGMAVFGRPAWNRNGEAFAVYFSLLSRLAPLGRDAEGRAVLRAPLAGLPSLRPRPGLVAFVMVVIGSTTFDGFTGTQVWQEWTGTLTGAADIAAGTAGLVGT